MARYTPQYGQFNKPYKAKPEPEVYEANEDDWDEDGNYIGPQYDDEQGGEEDEHWDEEEEEGDEWDEPAVQWYSVASSNKGKEKAVRGVSDVGDECYYDDLGLVNCWESALADYKFLHPSLFGPSRDAPRTQVQKRQHAPLWYGQSDPSTSAAAAAATQNATKRKAAQSNSKAAKKQRKAAAQQAVASTNQHSPVYTPQSPTHQRPHSPPPHIALPLPAGVSATASTSTPDTPSAHPQSSSASSSPAPPSHPKPPTTASLAGPRLPSPTDLPLSALPPPPAISAARLPAKFPPPPPLVPLTGEEEPQPSVSPEDLLTQALWAWYAAGYQTGLYHAAVGVAGAAAGPAKGVSGEGGKEGEDMDLETD